MGLLDRLLARDRQQAATRYADRESASDRAARKRRAGHRRHIPRAARQGQAWEDQERARERARYRR